MENLFLENIKFRKLNKEDNEIFIDLRMAYILETFDKISESEIDLLKINLNKYFSKHIEENDFIGIIGEYNNKIITAAYLIINDFPPNPNRKNGKAGTLLNVYTFSEYRRRGAARKLMEKVIAEAKRTGLNSIELKATNDGYNLYKSIGFIDDDINKNLIIRL